MTREQRRARREIINPKRKVREAKQLTTRQQRERRYRRTLRRSAPGYADSG